VKSIVIERDLGGTLQVSSGLQAGDRVVQISDATLHEGQKVEPVAPRVSPTPAPSAAPAASAR
jgi:hypothetical protein